MTDEIKVNTLPRWNYEKHIYEPYPVSDNVAMYREDFDSLVDCCECGKEVKFGDCYTSLRIHNYMGLGYAVCEKCYEKEWEERRKHRDDQY